MQAGDPAGRVGQAGRQPVDQAAGAVAPARSSCGSQPLCRRTNRADSPMPMRVEIRSSLAASTGPGTPTWIGRSTPRRRTRWTQAPTTLGWKQSWLTM